jgi:hypothetical protein
MWGLGKFRKRKLPMSKRCQHKESGKGGRVNTYRYSGGEGLGIKDMVGRVLGRFGVECLEEGLCKIELTHRACDLLGGSSRCDGLGQWVKGMPGWR